MEETLREVNEMSIILDDVKKTIGGSTEDNSFDIDLIIYINSTLGILSQLGLDEADATPIITETTTWEDLLGSRRDLEIVKTYIILKVKKMFDPPGSAAAIESMNQLISEFEWRINNLKIINLSNG